MRWRSSGVLQRLLYLGVAIFIKTREIKYVLSFYKSLLGCAVLTQPGREWSYIEAHLLNTRGAPIDIPATLIGLEPGSGNIEIGKFAFKLKDACDVRVNDIRVLSNGKRCIDGSLQDVPADVYYFNFDTEGFSGLKWVVRN